MEQDDGFGVWNGGVAEIIDVSIWPQTTDDRGAWGCRDGLALGADADAGLLTLDIGPPRAAGDGRMTERFSARAWAWPGGLAEFAVDFMLVGVRHELVQTVIGPDEFTDAVGSQEGDEAFLPVVVAAFDFAFGLGCWGVEQFDARRSGGLGPVG